MGSSFNYYKMFGWFNRKFKISESEPPPDVREAFWRYTGGETHMTAEHLFRFMVQHQEDFNCTEADVEAVMQHVFHRRHHRRREKDQHFSLEDFFYYLFQDDLNGPINAQVSLSFLSCFLFTFRCVVYLLSSVVLCEF